MISKFSKLGYSQGLRQNLHLTNLQLQAAGLLDFWLNGQQNPQDLQDAPEGNGPLDAGVHHQEEHAQDGGEDGGEFGSLPEPVPADFGLEGSLNLPEPVPVIREDPQLGPGPISPENSPEMEEASYHRRLEQGIPLGARQGSNVPAVRFLEISQRFFNMAVVMDLVDMMVDQAVEQTVDQTQEEVEGNQQVGQVDKE